MATGDIKHRRVADRSGVATLRGVSYRSYVRLIGEPANSHLRMTFHDGVLEIMSPRREHEQPASRIGMVVRAVTCELNIPCSGMRTTTFHRSGGGHHKGHGKEPDECFYLANEAAILGKESVDLDSGDPPLDLWIEVDHRASSLGKLPCTPGSECPNCGDTGRVAGRCASSPSAPRVATPRSRGA